MKILMRLLGVLTLLVSVTAQAVPKVEGRFIELQNTYNKPQWTQINFQQTYSVPPAVFMLSTQQGSNPAIVRIRNVTRSGFEALPLEPSGEDGEHVTMGAHYLAIEYGVHTFPDGDIVEVGQTTLTDELQYGSGSGFSGTAKSYQRLAFRTPFAQRPTFFHSLQTLNSVDSNPPHNALRPFLTIAVESGSLDTQGVNVAFEASQTAWGNIQAETMAYMVMEPGSNRSFVDDNGQTVTWESFFTGNAVKGWDDGCNKFRFTNDYAQAPLVVASKVSRNGGDGGWLRSCRVTRKELGVRVDEDRSVDKERSHDNEEASILAMTGTFVYSGDLPSCEAAFPGGLATYNNGGIGLHRWVDVNDPNDGRLQTTYYAQQSGGFGNRPQCDGQNCYASGQNALSASEAAAIPAVNNDGSTTSLPSNLNGDYYINSNYVTVPSNLSVSGPSRIFIEPANVGDATYLHFNQYGGRANQGGWPPDLSIYVNGDVGFAPNYRFNGYIFATGSVYVERSSVITGAVTSGGWIEVGNSGVVNYQPVRSLPGICGREVIEVIDHYRFELADDQGSSCAAKPLTIKACADPNCDTLFSQPASLSLVPASNAQQSWYPGDDVNFVGQQQLYLDRLSQGNLSLGTHDEIPGAPLLCFIGGNQVGLNDCKVKFSEDGLVFKNLDAGNQTIPVQLSAKPSDTGYQAATLALEACGNSDAAKNQTLSVNLNYQCSNGAAGCSQALQFSQGVDHALSQTSQSFDLTFDNKAQAQFVLTYPDAGKVSLKASMELVVNPQTGATRTFSGTSNEFVVRPLGLDVQLPNDPASIKYAADASDSLYRLTGQPFTLSAQAVGWQAADDRDNDGQPDDFSTLHNNPKARHFAQDPLALSAALQLPVGGVSGTLSHAQLNFNNQGLASGGVSYDQVGIIGIRAGLEDGDYYGSGDVNGGVNNVGRFAPSQFVVENASVAQACTQGSGFTYLGEPVGGIYFALQARNHKGEVMQNYRAGFDKAQPRLLLENQDSSHYRPGNDFIARVSSNISTVWPQNAANAGTLSANNASLMLARATMPDGPFSAMQLHLMLDAREGASFFIDQGGILLPGHEDANSQSACSNCGVILNTLALRFRYGRLWLDNSFGSESEPLLVPMQAQYWNANHWALNELDSCFAYQAGELMQSPATVSPALTFSNDGVLQQGQYLPGEGIRASSGGHSGTVEVEYPAPDWLLWDWDQDGNADNNPAATLQFGRFRGNDRIIYWRELHR